MDPATVAALIGAAAAAADTAVSATLNELNKEKSKNPVACVFINNTPYQWETVPGYGKPYHGQMRVAPAGKVVSLIEGADKSGESDWTETNHATWGLKSTGVGTDCVIVYRCPKLKYYAAFYAGNHATPPFAGVSLSEEAWFKKQPVDDPKGKWIRKHIKEVHTPLCAYSKGSAEEVRLGHIQVKFQPAIEEARFEMSFDGDWSSFEMSH